MPDTVASPADSGAVRSDQPEKIRLENIYKIFGPDPQSVLPLVQQGMGKAEVQEKHGHVVGINNVSLSIRRAETFVIMGLSGSGKSTIIRHINRLIEPTAGRILVDGDDVLQLTESDLRQLRREKISMVFQRFALLPHKTVIENVMYGLTIQKIAKDQARQRAKEQIDIVGLSGFEDNYPRQLSGGMQQRVGLARALATDAEILLMDEAFSALDPLIRHDMQDQLLDLQRTLHKTIVFITHDLDEALRLGDHIAILKDGELRQVGTGEEILLNPADDYVSRFVRDVNRGRVVTVSSIVRQLPTVGIGELSGETVSKLWHATDADVLFVLDEHGRPVGAVRETHVAKHAGEAENWWRNPDNLDDVTAVPGETVLEDALPAVATPDAYAAVVDDEGRYVGAVNRDAAVEAMIRPPEQEEEDDGNASPDGDGSGAPHGDDSTGRTAD